MSVITADCPRCGIKKVAFTVRDEGCAWNAPFPGRQDMTMTAYDNLAACGNCGRAVVATFVGGDLTEIVPSPPRPPEHLPPNIGSFFQQAMSNLAQNWDAAGMMFRKTLEAALKNKFANIQGTLSQRINEAAKQQKLTPELAQWAHQIRLDGNDAAHGDKPLSKEDAQSLADFTHLVLLYLFTLPGMLVQAQASSPKTP